MKIHFILLVVMLFAFSSNAQVKSVEKTKVYLKEKEGIMKKIGLRKKVGLGKYQIYYVPNAQKKDEQTGKTYVGGVTTYTEKENKLDYSTGKTVFNDATLTILNGVKLMWADIEQDKGVLKIYPWPYTDPKPDSDEEKYNDFIEKNTLFIEYGSRAHLKFPCLTWHLSALTIPFKVFVTSKQKIVSDNYLFDISTNIAAGYRWGKKHFYYLPNEKEGKSYINSTSLNFIVGLNKIDLNANNSLDSTLAGKSYPTLSTGVGVGFHYRNALSFFAATGVDHPLTAAADVNWVFTRQLWIGFGLGFKFLEL